MSGQACSWSGRRCGACRNSAISPCIHSRVYTIVMVVGRSHVPSTCPRHVRDPYGDHESHGTVACTRRFREKLHNLQQTGDVMGLGEKKKYSRPWQ